MGRERECASCWWRDSSESTHNASVILVTTMPRRRLKAWRPCPLVVDLPSMIGVCWSAKHSCVFVRVARLCVWPGCACALSQCRTNPQASTRIRPRTSSPTLPPRAPARSPYPFLQFDPPRPPRIRVKDMCPRATWVLTGHSERRTVMGESDKLVAGKTKFALDSGMRVTFCIGENLEQRESGQMEEVCIRQCQALIDEGARRRRRRGGSYGGEVVWWGGVGTEGGGGGVWMGGSCIGCTVGLFRGRREAEMRGVVLYNFTHVWQHGLSHHPLPFTYSCCTFLRSFPLPSPPPLSTTLPYLYPPQPPTTSHNNTRQSHRPRGRSNR